MITPLLPPPFFSNHIPVDSSPGFILSIITALSSKNFRQVWCVAGDTLCLQTIPPPFPFHVCLTYIIQTKEYQDRYTYAMQPLDYINN